MKVRRDPVAPAPPRCREPCQENIDMDKPTTNGPRDLEERAAKALVVPDTKFPRDGEWHPENAALQQAAGASSALGDFYREQQEIEIEIRRYQETGKSITWDDCAFR